MMETTHIYILADPRNGEIRYVGKTSKSVASRLRMHIKEAGNHCFAHKRSHKLSWLRQLRAAHRRPVATLVEVVRGDGCMQEREWIAAFRKAGARLTNLTDGGDGVAGCRLTEEHKRKLRDANTGKVMSEETKRKVSIGKTGHKLTPEHCAVMSEMRRGVKQSPEVIARRYAYALGKRRRMSVFEQWTLHRILGYGVDHTLADEEALRKDYTALKGRLLHLGRKATAETKARISAALRGRKHGAMSCEHRAKISAAHKGMRYSADVLRRRVISWKVTMAKKTNEVLYAQRRELGFSPEGCVPIFVV